MAKRTASGGDRPHNHKQAAPVGAARQNNRLTGQIRKVLGKHYANKYGAKRDYSR